MDINIEILGLPFPNVSLLTFQYLTPYRPKQKFLSIIMDAPVEVQKLVKEHGKLEANTALITNEGFNVENPFPLPN